MKLKLKAFLLGVLEFRQNVTTHFEYPLAMWYDAGRELCHVLTFRRFES